MSRTAPVSLLSIGFLLSACVTINVYFPAAAAEKAADRIIEVGYEKLVTDFEAEARRLIGFLGLDWTPACLDFHKSDLPVLTASLHQVRQPLYASSIGRWRAYERQLSPLLAALSPDAEP